MMTRRDLLKAGAAAGLVSAVGCGSIGLSEPPGFIRPTSHGNTPPGPDARVQRITQNLFQRFLA